jgi:coproporphyrinogen III oxidase-like Fe-S oxidoreductase
MMQTELYQSILIDLKTQAQGLGPRHLASIFFGGGTPSLMQPEWIEGVITEAKLLFKPLRPEIEVSLEANPTDTEISRYVAFRQAGINRLSIGVQSFDNDALIFLGRNHSAEEAINGIKTGLSVFDRVSLDLIYALPQQSIEAWQAQLRLASKMGVEHISPYQLSLEANTAFGRAARRGQLSLPPEDIGFEFYETTQTTLSNLGFEAYEVSNHAKGKAAQSRHNVNIWEGIDYIGVGPGAHGRLTIANAPERPREDAAHGRLTMANARFATIAEPNIKAYMAKVRDYGLGCSYEALSSQEAKTEALMLGLRLSEGVSLERLEGLLMPRLDGLMEAGFLEHMNGRLRATQKGRVVLDRLLYELLS